MKHRLIILLIGLCLAIGTGCFGYIYEGDSDNPDLLTKWINEEHGVSAEEPEEPEEPEELIHIINQKLVYKVIQGASASERAKLKIEYQLEFDREVSARSSGWNVDVNNYHNPYNNASSTASVWYWMMIYSFNQQTVEEAEVIGDTITVSENIVRANFLVTSEQTIDWSNFKSTWTPEELSQYIAKPITISEQGIVRNNNTVRLYYIVFDYDKDPYFVPPNDIMIGSSDAFGTYNATLRPLSNGGAFSPSTYAPRNVVVYRTVSGSVRANRTMEIQDTSPLLLIHCSNSAKETDLSSLITTYPWPETIQAVTDVDIDSQARIIVDREINLFNNVDGSVETISAPGGMIWDDFFEDYSFPIIEGYECLGIATHPATIPMFGVSNYEVVYKPLTPLTE